MSPKQKRRITQLPTYYAGPFPDAIPAHWLGRVPCRAGPACWCVYGGVVLSCAAKGRGMESKPPPRFFPRSPLSPSSSSPSPFFLSPRVPWIWISRILPTSGSRQEGLRPCDSAGIWRRCGSDLAPGRPPSSRSGIGIFDSGRNVTDAEIGESRSGFLVWFFLGVKTNSRWDPPFDSVWSSVSL